MKRIILYSALSILSLSVVCGQGDKTNKRISTNNTDKSEAPHPVSSKRISTGHAARDRTATTKPADTKPVSNKRIQQSN